MKSNCDISIRRQDSSLLSDNIIISIRDRNACITFVEIEIDSNSFMQALTGVADVACNMKTQHADKIGKHLHKKPIRFELEGHMNRRAIIEKARELCDDGWEINDLQNIHLFDGDDGKTRVEMFSFKWEDEPPHKDFSL